MSEPLAVLTQIRAEIEAAADVFLEAAAAGLRELPAVSSGDAAATARLEAHLLGILEGCAFQDLTGQRLDQLAGMIAPASSPAPASDPLLNGPALAGEGLDQAAADRLFLES